MERGCLSPASPQTTKPSKALLALFQRNRRASIHTLVLIIGTLAPHRVNDFFGSVSRHYHFFDRLPDLNGFIFEVQLERLPSDRHGRPLTDAVKQAGLYSITSSARASSVGGTSIPSARAVLRLRTKPSLVGRCTGMSAGFSPLNIRAV
jgi:hypothetical protein